MEESDILGNIWWRRHWTFLCNLFIIFNYRRMSGHSCVAQQCTSVVETTYRRSCDVLRPKIKKEGDVQRWHRKIPKNRFWKESDYYKKGTAVVQHELLWWLWKKLRCLFFVFFVPTLPTLPYEQVNLIEDDRLDKPDTWRSWYCSCSWTPPPQHACTVAKKSPKVCCVRLVRLSSASPIQPNKSYTTLLLFMHCMW